MAAALGAAPAWASLGREASPLERGPHRVARALLGLSPGTTRLPVPEEVPFSSQLLRCSAGHSQVVRPGGISAAVILDAIHLARQQLSWFTEQQNVQVD